MKCSVPEVEEPSAADNIPEDVAALYSWAKLQGAKYRDYSASRREQRAQSRYRAAKALLEKELTAQKEAESAVQRAEQAALIVQVVVHAADDHEGSDSQADLLQSVEAAAQKAAAERVEAARCAAATAQATVLALREQREIAEAHSSAQQQAEIYAKSELRRRELAGPQPYPVIAGESTSWSLSPAEPSSKQQFLQLDMRVNESGGDAVGLDFEPVLKNPGAKPLAPLEVVGETIDIAAGEADPANLFTDAERDTDAEREPRSPAWLSISTVRDRALASSPIALEYPLSAPEGDTLQDSREKVAARWYALKEVFDSSAAAPAALPPVQAANRSAPIVAVFSIAGGVGKTTLVSTLGRALAMRGEKVMLADTTSRGILPLYFGVPALRSAQVRVSDPPVHGTGQPISLVAYDLSNRDGTERYPQLKTQEIVAKAHGNQRLLVDLATDSDWLLRQIVKLHPVVLVPVTPEMSSVVSLAQIETRLSSMTDSEGRPPQSFYLLNRFDPALPLHLDIREVFRRKLGDRLLPFAIRDSPAIGEALAEGVTVVDYAAGGPVLSDFTDVASWLCSVSPPSAELLEDPRWGEQ
jgi:cellulose synthase operon protein YhjQ